MRWIVGSSLRLRWLILFAGAALIVFGIGETRNADVDGFPEFAPPMVEIQLIFSRDTDLYEARQLVQERLTEASPNLPTWASPPWMMPPLSSTSRILKIGITSDELNMREMSVIAYWKIRQELLRVDGVANVPIYGEQLKQEHVEVDPELLAEHGVS